MKNKGTLTAFVSADVRVRDQVNSPQRILVADDEPCICHLSSEVLIRHGYEVNAAEDGAVAWEELNARAYDLLITDNNMPKLSGVGLLKKLRAISMEVPVIMITGQLPEEEFRRYPWLRPDATLLKPFTVAELVGTVKKVLSEAEEKSAYFQSLSQATAQLSFDWKTLAVAEGTVGNFSARPSV